MHGTSWGGYVALRSLFNPSTVPVDVTVIDKAVCNVYIDRENFRFGSPVKSFLSWFINRPMWTLSNPRNYTYRLSLLFGSLEDSPESYSAEDYDKFNYCSRDLPRNKRIIFLHGKKDKRAQFKDINRLIDYNSQHTNVETLIFENGTHFSSPPREKYSETINFILSQAATEPAHSSPAAR